MTRFSDFTDDELDMMEEAFCNEGLKYLVFEIRKERSSRMFVEPQESDLGDYPDAIHNQFDNMTGSMNL